MSVIEEPERKDEFYPIVISEIIYQNNCANIIQMQLGNGIIGLYQRITDNPEIKHLRTLLFSAVEWTNQKIESWMFEHGLTGGFHEGKPLFTTAIKATKTEEVKEETPLERARRRMRNVSE